MWWIFFKPCQTLWKHMLITKDTLRSVIHECFSAEHNFMKVVSILKWKWKFCCKRGTFEAMATYRLTAISLFLKPLLSVILNISEVKLFQYHMTVSFLKNEAFNFYVTNTGFTFWKNDENTWYWRKYYLFRVRGVRWVIMWHCAIRFAQYIVFFQQKCFL